jgi:hypothetical protein
MFGLRSRVRNRDSARSADNRTNEEQLDAARTGDEGEEESGKSLAARWGWGSFVTW